MKICVTGAQGYIGGWLVPALQARGHQVHTQDVAPGAGDRFDLRDTPARRAWLRETRPGVVIHLAALYGRVWGEQDMVATAGANAGLAAEVARDTATAGARLMFMSSSEVYGASAAEGTVHPGSVLRPLNMYGLSKKWGEEACRLYAPDGLMICRLNMPYGPAAAPPPAGEVPRTSGRPGITGYNVLHSMLWQAAHGLGLTVHRGTSRCLTWAGDTVRGLAMIAGSGLAGTWNVCRDDDHVPVAELAARVIALTGSPSRITEEDPPAGVTRRKSLDNTGLLDLGWRPETGLDEGMKAAWDYFRRFGRDGRWMGE